MPGPELEAGRVFVDLIPRMKEGYGAGIEKELSGPLARIRSKVGGLGKMLSAGLAVGAAAGAAFLFDAGEKIEKSFITIEQRTGATGQKLAGLKQSFRDVARDVPDSLSTVADALSTVSQRTDLSGKPLDELTKKYLNLARVTKQDVGQTVETSTRLFGKWGISVHDQGKKLDELYRASQLTGIGVNDLSEQMTKFGSPLQLLGFNFDQSAALLGNFEKAGVNTGVAMAGLKAGLGKMAKAGEAPVETLSRVEKMIKSAGSAADANAIAVKVFGNRAGPELATAIRKGRFEVGGLVADITSGKTSIDKTAESTLTFSQKFDILKNKAMLAVEPIAGKLIDGIDSLVEHLGPAAHWIGERLPGAFAAVKRAIAPIVQGVKDFVHGFTVGVDGLHDPQTKMARLGAVVYQLWTDKIRPALVAMGSWIHNHLKPILIGAAIAFGLLTAPITTLVAGLVYAYVKFGWFRTAVNAVVKWLIRNVPPAFAAVKRAAEVAFRWIQTNVVPIVVKIAKGVANAIASLVKWWRQHWASIREAVGHVIRAIGAVIAAGVASIMFVWKHFGGRILSVIRAAWDLIKSTVKNGIRFVRSIIQAVIDLINGDWGKFWDDIKGAAAAVWDEIWAIVKYGLAVVTNGISSALTALSLIWSGIWNALGDVASGIWTGILMAVQDGVNLFLKGVAWLVNKAIDIVNDVLGGINDVSSYVGIHLSLIDHVKGWSIELVKPKAKPASPTIVGGRHPIPRAKGGPLGPGDLALVGERGPELLQLGHVGAHVYTNGQLADALAGAGRAHDAAGPGVVFEKESILVDARGIETPETVGDYAARQIGWRLTTRGRR